MKKTENNFSLTGFIAVEPKTSDLTNKAKTVVSLSVARKDNNDNRVSALQTIEFYHDKGAALGFKKGDLMTVKGFFRPEEWTTKEGEKRSRIVWIANSIEAPEEKAE